MSFSYTIMYSSKIDRFTGLPIAYVGPPVPAEYRPFLTNQEQWSMRFASILFQEIHESVISVRCIVEQIRSYNDIAELLVDAGLHLYWTREKHEQFLRAIRFFADQGFNIICW